MKHFWAYLQERFPLQANGVLIASYFIANYLLAGSVYLQNNLPIEISWKFIAGCLVLIFMFFHMRIIDEHKDFERDVLAYPNRVLSRGLITLKQLKNIGIVVIFFELFFSFLFGLSAFFMCIVLLIFSWLIYKEFYIAEFLEKHLIINAFVHLLIMPLYSLYVFALVTNQFAWQSPLEVLLYAWVSYGVGFGYEVARKTRVPEDERPHVITYSKVIGAYPSAMGVLLALVFSGGISLLVGYLLEFGWWYHAVVTFLLLVVAIGVIRFRVHTTSATAHHLQIYAGVFIFAFDILLAVELINQHGVMWK